MEKLTLTFVKRTPKVSERTGKPFTSLSIKCEEYPNKWLSGFDGKETASWKEGDVVEADVEEKGQYLNFSVPRAPKAYPAPQGAPQSGDTEKIAREIRAIGTEVINLKTTIGDMKGVLTDILAAMIKKGDMKIEDVLPETPFPTEDDLKNVF